jgi:hypothetical protein
MCRMPTVSEHGLPCLGCHLCTDDPQPCCRWALGTRQRCLIGWNIMLAGTRLAGRDLHLGACLSCCYCSRDWFRAVPSSLLLQAVQLLQQLESLCQHEAIYQTGKSAHFSGMNLRWPQLTQAALLWCQLTTFDEPSQLDWHVMCSTDIYIHSSKVVTCHARHGGQCKVQTAAAWCAFPQVCTCSMKSLHTKPALDKVTPHEQVMGTLAGADSLAAFWLQAPPLAAAACCQQLLQLQPQVSLPTAHWSGACCTSGPWHLAEVQPHPSLCCWDQHQGSPSSASSSCSWCTAT